jgi:hypothetical protein
MLWKNVNALFFYQKFMNVTMLCGRIVVVKLKGLNRLQFPSELISPSFSDSPGLQDNVSDSLWSSRQEFLATDPEVRIWFPALSDFLASGRSGMGLYWKKSLSSTVMTWLRKSRSDLSQSRISADASFRHTLQSLSNFLGLFVYTFSHWRSHKF